MSFSGNRNLNTSTDPGRSRAIDPDMALRCRGVTVLNITCLKNRTRKEEDVCVSFCTRPLWRWSHLILTISQKSKWYYPHFMGKETEGWGGGEIACTKFYGSWISDSEVWSLISGPWLNYENFQPWAQYLWEKAMFCLLNAQHQELTVEEEISSLELSSGIHQHALACNLTYIVHTYIQ